jgi:MraZ protein
VVKSGRRWRRLRVMSSFSGKYYYTVDPKGRIIIPAPFREIISANYNPILVFVNHVFEPCLHAFPSDVWNKHLEEIKKLPRSDEAIDFYLNRVVASATEIEIDKQGRVIVPHALREDAVLNSDVAIIGQIDRIALWNKKTWTERFDPTKVDRKAFAERYVSYGL